jgi:hypothetical protein
VRLSSDLSSIDESSSWNPKVPQNRKGPAGIFMLKLRRTARSCPITAKESGGGLTASGLAS